MDAIYVIRRPLLTEKGTYHMDENRRYTFEVARGATKPEIKKAIEHLYKVKVEKVNTQIRKGRERRLKYGLTNMPDVKMAMVKLIEGSTIELV